ncbi:L-aspartate oxidase [Gracilibacillus kekensis]|uniref:L-aspartate oxidase n=1 Tax=Gracilibacillus kekensis TaxID=1027249 RepID=A0A1M7NXY2_9BACI|nr:L-aspartate oxidase [Gracilibacillus kekensis]SHN09023.1 L-aspartate oxidase [Gracilibacillus kekensis]
MQQKVVIIGAGIAAHALANQLYSQFDVTMITKKKWKNSNSFRAQGGVAAAIASNDHWRIHLEDTLKAGVYHNDKALTELMVKEGQSILKTLLRQGFPADKDVSGQLLLGKEGAHSKRRIIHAGGDQTGKYVIQYYQRILQNKIHIIENQLAVDCVIENGHCTGIITIDNKEQYVFHPADHVVLATGGYGAIYDTTSNDETTTGDGISIAYRAGAAISDLEFVQFHPTMLSVPEKQNILISEAVRGEGAILIDREGRAIMKDQHPQKDLAPRDVISRIVTAEISKGKEIFLDISKVKNFPQRFPFITSICERYNIDWKKGTIPIQPGAHFTMGGVETNEHGETSIPRLYAVGEVACNYVHGANRLASNSLLEGIVFATRLAELIRNQKPLTSSTTAPVTHRAAISSFALPEKADLRKRMTAFVGINRKSNTLRKMSDWLGQYTIIKDQPLYNISLSKKQIELQHMLLVANLVTNAAESRTESRGAHYRIDYPDSVVSWREKRIYHQLKRGVVV